MIEHDGNPTIASRRSDPLLEKALAAGGHLADDVATAFLKKDRIINKRTGEELEVTLISDDPALD